MATLHCFCGTLIAVEVSVYCVLGTVHFTHLLTSLTLNSVLTRKIRLYSIKWRNTVGIQSQSVKPRVRPVTSLLYSTPEPGAKNQRTEFLLSTCPLSFLTQFVLQISICKFTIENEPNRFPEYSFKQTKLMELLTACSQHAQDKRN